MKDEGTGFAKLRKEQALGGREDLTTVFPYTYQVVLEKAELLSSQGCAVKTQEAMGHKLFQRVFVLL